MAQDCGRLASLGRTRPHHRRHSSSPPPRCAICTLCLWRDRHHSPNGASSPPEQAGWPRWFAQGKSDPRKELALLPQRCCDRLLDSMETIHKYKLEHRDKQTELYGCPSASPSLGPSKHRPHRPWRITERGRVLSPTIEVISTDFQYESASFIFTPPSFLPTSFMSGSPYASNLPVLLTLCT